MSLLDHWAKYMSLLDHWAFKAFYFNIRLIDLYQVFFIQMLSFSIFEYFSFLSNSLKRHLRQK